MKSCPRNRICVTIVFVILCFSLTSCFNFFNLYYYERSIVVKLVNGSNVNVGFVAPFNYMRTRRPGSMSPFFHRIRDFNGLIWDN